MSLARIAWSGMGQGVKEMSMLPLCENASSSSSSILEQSRILEIITGERQLLSRSGRVDPLTSEHGRKQASGFFNIFPTDIKVRDGSKATAANRIDQEARLLQLGDELRR